MTFHEETLKKISHKNSRAVWVCRDKEGKIRATFKLVYPSELLLEVAGDEVFKGAWNEQEQTR